MNIKDLVSFLITIGSTVLVVFLFSENLGEFVLNLLVVIALYIGASIFAGFISLRITRKLARASEEELRTEDSVLLRGIGFFQSTAFIYLTLVGTDEGFSILSLLIYFIPVVTGLFFITRGYGSIKRNNFWRLSSNVILIWFLIFEIVMYVALSVNLSPENVKLFYLFLCTTVVLIALTDKIIEILSPRYGIFYKRKTFLKIEVRESNTNSWNEGSLER